MNVHDRLKDYFGLKIQIHTGNATQMCPLCNKLANSGGVILPEELLPLTLSSCGTRRLVWYSHGKELKVSS